jgi:hypothetical protein
MFSSLWFSSPVAKRRIPLHSRREGKSRKAAWQSEEEEREPHGKPEHFENILAALGNPELLTSAPSLAVLIFTCQLGNQKK